MLRYRLRTLLIVLVLVSPFLTGCLVPIYTDDEPPTRELSAPEATKTAE